MDYEEDYDADSAGEGLSSEELSLPRATITKMIQEMLPNDIVCTKETRDLLIDCCIEFIHLISSEANDACEKDSRKTISPEHVATALQNLGFHAYIDPVKASYEDHKQSTKDRQSKNATRLDKLGISEDQLLLEQEALFERARQKYLANNSNGTQPISGLEENLPVVAAQATP